MVAMAAAFLGETLGASAVADSYVLCNPACSLLDCNFMENWVSGHLTDDHGNTGRQKYAARTQTLKAFFFNILRTRSTMQQDAALVDACSANRKPECKDSYTAAFDRADHGLHGSSYGRVTLYFNPHDQVISATPVQGMGWRGMSAQEIADTGGDGVFTQRVFAQNHLVGQENEQDYDIWQRNGLPLTPDSLDFWHPRSLIAEYSIAKGMRASKGIGRKILTFLFAPIVIILAKTAGTRINALPPKVWRLSMRAPKLPVPFLPHSKRFADISDQFDEGCDAPADSLRKDRAADADDAYAPHRSRGKGDAHTEAALRYEQNGMLRMQARRDGWVEKGKPVTAVDQPDEASKEFNAWRKNEIRNYLAANIDTHSTDHSTIMTNPEHAQKALAYDVAAGVCTIRQEALRKLRVTADWSLLNGASFESSEFFEYYDNGTFKAVSLFAWANHKDSPARKTKGIIDERQNTKPASSDRLGQLAQALSLEVPDFDFLPQTFNTPALLGEMGAGTALTNVALAIAHANHVGMPVLVAGSSDPDCVTGVLVTPPATVRPINHDKPWFRARGENNAYLPCWGSATTRRTTCRAIPNKALRCYTARARRHS